MVFCSSQMLEKFSSHESKTSDLKISLAWVMNKTPHSHFLLTVFTHSCKWHDRKRGFLFSFLIDFVNMLVRNTYPVQFPLIEPSAAISKASSPWAHRHVFSYNRCFLWLWSHNGALKQRFHEVGLLRINTLKLLLYVPNIGQFWQYIVCTAELA